MRLRHLVAPALLLAALAPYGAAAHDPLCSNEWLTRQSDGAVLNISHQGGENEAPSNTMYAFKTSIPKGADVLELDVHATKDGHLVVLHDASVNRTTNGAGRVDQLTLAQIQVLDAAHWFVPGLGTTSTRPASEYVYRGIATEATPAPSGYTASDFRIPTLDEVLTTFPSMRINIEIKNTVPDTTPYEKTLADLLAAHGRGHDTIVVSFLDHATEMFKAFAPGVDTATGTGETALFKISAGFAPNPALAPVTAAPPGAPNPRYQALQVPVTFNGIEVVTPDFVADAHANCLSVHVWTIDDQATMEWLVDIGVDGIMSNVPTLLEQVLVAKGVAI